MSKTIDTRAKVNELMSLLIEREGYAYTSGYMIPAFVEVLELLPKTKRQAFLAKFEHEIKSRYTTTVKNIMTGADVTITLDQVGGPCDPSTERYWSM